MYIHTYIIWYVYSYIYIYVYYVSLVWWTWDLARPSVFFHGIVSSHQQPSVPSCHFRSSFSRWFQPEGGFGNGILNFDSAEELRQASVQELKRVSFGEESEVRGWRGLVTFAGGFKHVSFATLFWGDDPIWVKCSSWLKPRTRTAVGWFY